MMEHNVAFYSSDEENQRRNEFVKLLRECPIPDNELLDNIGIFLTSKTLSRIQFMDFLYQKIVEIPGVVIEFGTRWGQNAALFSSLRGIYEPFNRTRKIVAFDTFAGFPGVSGQDGSAKFMAEGSYAVSDNYCNYLDKVMLYHELENPLSHIKKYELVKGNAVETLPLYLGQNPETIISLAYFDFDLYEPTKVCLEIIKNRLVKGSIVGFDELNEHAMPGETLAVMEVFGLNNIELRRLRHVSRVSYFEVK
jgi:hypothetical protein